MEITHEDGFGRGEVPVEDDAVVREADGVVGGAPVSDGAEGESETGRAAGGGAIEDEEIVAVDVGVKKEG